MMQDTYISAVARELSIGEGQVAATAALLADSATIPFIARYRKEATGALDEVAVAAIRDRLEQMAELDKRRDAVLASLSERGLLDDALKEKVGGAKTLSALEDIYLPYRPKRRTRATIAREKGLEPLADLLWAQGAADPADAALPYVDAGKGVASADDALAGARDILAERVSEDADARAAIRSLYFEKGVLRSRVAPGKEAEGAKYRDYFEWDEATATAPSHRVLAMRRGEKEGFLYLRLTPPEDEAVALLCGRFVGGEGAASMQVRAAVEDGYRRLLGPAIETEARMEGRRRADAEAIRVFASNLRQLLLSPAAGQKNVLALDPGFRTGCKAVCLDRQGKLLHAETIYPHASERQRADAVAAVLSMCEKYSIELVAVGNGTAGRETEAFLRAQPLPGQPSVVSVNESGASIYSASEIAREEFPDHDLTVRGSVSIGRRLMDPLAELVKIDPKSIGVGQYQHDVEQPALRRSLDDVVESCVNAVGVEVNTASRPLLSYVSGLGPSLATAIVSYRDAHGPYASRDSLRKVPRLGPKAFEQAAGFLRIREGENPLDGSAVHPESYPIVEAMARDLGCAPADLMRDAALREKIVLSRYVTETVGLPTLNDILAELARPGRDPRERFEAVRFADGVEKMEDLVVGMRLPGIVTNVTAFGAFVDIGVHQDGLVHISRLADRFVQEPSEIVKVQQRVTVTVVEVDLPRRRIALSMRSSETVPPSEGAGSSGAAAHRTSPAAPRAAAAGGRHAQSGHGSGMPKPGKPASPRPAAPLSAFAEALAKARKSSS
ncbi:MAG TPA: Tex family protein [Candidatus Deferrimicrobiaceae bacterium]|jgi:uncharacterized protein